jgi:general secretion pathway protein H
MALTGNEAAKVMTPISGSSPPHKAFPAKIQRGFTLLEILLVFTIIAMASILVVPNVGNMDSRTFTVQLRQVNSILHYARRNAVITGLPSTARLYTSSRGPRDELAVNLAQEVIWESQGIALQFEDSTERVTDVEDFVDFTFYPEGGSTGGTLILAQNGRETRLVVDPFTGRISSEESDEAI